MFCQNWKIASQRLRWHGESHPLFTSFSILQILNFEFLVLGIEFRQTARVNVDADSDEASFDEHRDVEQHVS